MTKTVMITGASSGFGEASARKFAKMESDCSLVLVARRLDKLEALAAELEGQCSVYVAELDVRDKQAVAGFLPGLPENLRAIDVLINNAGLALGLEPAHEVDLEDWENMVDTNIKGLMRVTRHILPGMVQRNNGHIINLGSIAGDWPYPGGNVYCSTKAFVHQYSRTLRADLLGKNIRVTTVAPGMSETEFSNGGQGLPGNQSIGGN